MGEIYYQRGTRIVYFTESGYTSRVYGIMFFGVTLLISSSVPLALGYFSEFRLFSLVEIYDFFYYLFAFYFILDFYISVYLFVMSFTGHNFKFEFTFLLRAALGFLTLNSSFLTFL